MNENSKPAYAVKMGAHVRVLSVLIELDATNEPHAILPLVTFNCAIRPDAGMPEVVDWPGQGWQKITLQLKPDWTYAEELLEKVSRMVSIIIEREEKS